ncbi:PucR family transcriptional regulator ligand-binding domain-containing protein [Lachnospiraceae bacterium 54-53]
MRTQVSELLHSTKEKYSLVLHSGEEGLTNSVSWVYLAEDFQNISFLKGGELVITTGLFTRSGISLSKFICALVTRNCSGILINVGRYIDIPDLTEEILEFCRSNKFPLITMPWKIHLIDIMQDYCRTLLKSTQTMDLLNAAFESAICQKPLQENTLLTLNQHGFPTEAEYRMIVIRNLRKTESITFSLNHRNLKYHLFEHDHRHILIYRSTQALLSEILDILLFCDSITLGISSLFHSLKEFDLCCKQACFALACASYWCIPSVNFDDLGIFQILFSSSDPEMLKNIYRSSLGKLENFDTAHDSDYMETLRTFLLSDCNLLETAEKMHAHRNTIIYRLKKIKDILGTELDNSRIKFDLLTAFYIREYFLI